MPMTSSPALARLMPNADNADEALDELAISARASQHHIKRSASVQAVNLVNVAQALIQQALRSSTVKGERYRLQHAWIWLGHAESALMDAELEWSDALCTVDEAKAAIGELVGQAPAVGG